MMKTDKFHLIDLTNKLLTLVEEASIQFKKTKQNEQYEVDFYGEIQPFVRRVDKLIEEWQPLAISWLTEGRVKYLYERQIESTVEHLKTVSVLVFQSKASKKRVVEMLKSIRYILDRLLTEIESYSENE